MAARAEDAPQAARQVREWVLQRDVNSLVEALFDESLTPTQAEIVRTIAYREEPRVAITAYTQYGKTWAVAVAICLLLVITPKPLEVLIVSARLDQAKRLRKYLADLILQSPTLQADLQLQSKGVERLQKEVSKTRLTFKSGHELKILSAHGKADRLMGWGGDVVVLDEAALLSPEAYAKVGRMVGGTDGDLIELSNPWDRLNGFWKAWNSPRYVTFHIPWQVGVEEGRITRDFVMEQREKLPPIMFQILYDAEFPQDVEDALIKWEWIQRATQRSTDAPRGARPVWGLDVAEGGTDQTVLARGKRTETEVVVEDLQEWDEADTRATTRLVKGKLDPEWEGNVDAIGVGKGVVDNLRNDGYAANAWKASRKPQDEDYRNAKAEAWWRLRELFERDAISIPDHPELVEDLTRARYEVRNGRVVVWHEDDDNDSPDHGDAVMLLAAGKQKRRRLRFR